jgi:uncharacterized protein
MHLDLTEVLRGPSSSMEMILDIPAGQLDEWELTEPVTGFVRASNARRNIVISGKAKTSLTLQCSRCLCDYSQPLDLVLDVTVPLSTFNKQLGAAAVSVDDYDDDGQELTQEDIDALFKEQNLNVTELVRQAIVLGQPIQPLCQPDCAGIPEISNYREEAIDPRLEALRDLSTKHMNGSSASVQGETSPED